MPRYSLNHDFDTEFSSPFTKVCRPGAAISSVHSRFSLNRDDRRFKIGCSPVRGLAGGPCRWSEYSPYLEKSDYYCGRGRYLRGWRSLQSDKFEDRRMSFLCCHTGPEVELRRCGETENVNFLQTRLDFTADIRNSYVITGILSDPARVHRRVDRLYAFVECQAFYRHHRH